MVFCECICSTILTPKSIILYTANPLRTVPQLREPQCEIYFGANLAIALETLADWFICADFNYTRAHHEFWQPPQLNNESALGPK